MTIRLLDFVEDVGRHNAVDAIAGHMWLDNIEGEGKIFIPLEDLLLKWL